MYAVALWPTPSEVFELKRLLGGGAMYVDLHAATILGLTYAGDQIYPQVLVEGTEG